jgi:Glyoxalase/Bleomycin resistance protein/Dioxygenase superfamily
VQAGGAHAIAANEHDYLELIATRNVLVDGIRGIALGSDDPAAKVAAIGDLQYVGLAPAGRCFPAARHPNGVLRLERVYIAVEDLAASVIQYSRALAMPAPAIERGTVINAHMAAFNIGGAGLTLAQPAGPGVAADALARRGPGPFQVLYRTSSMDAAARWMADHGVPPPARGIRNTGEQAMLVTPDYACGAYIGFVGPA